jgi:hypothetical protein
MADYVFAGLGVHVQHRCGADRCRCDLPRWSRSSFPRVGITGDGIIVSLVSTTACGIKVLTYCAQVCLCRRFFFVTQVVQGTQSINPTWHSSI